MTKAPSAAGGSGRLGATPFWQGLLLILVHFGEFGIDHIAFDGLLALRLGTGTGCTGGSAFGLAAADGVVVGSALVNVIKDNLANRAAIPAAMRARAADLISGLKPAK